MLENSAAVQLLVRALKEGRGGDFKSSGNSMYPLIRPGDLLRVEPVLVSELKEKHVALYVRNQQLIVHRIISIETLKNGQRWFCLKGDSSWFADRICSEYDLLGRIVSVNGVLWEDLEHNRIMRHCVLRQLMAAKLSLRAIRTRIKRFRFGDEF